MLAVLGGHTDCVRFLLAKEAVPDAKDKRGSTALHRGVSQKLSLYGCLLQVYLDDIKVPTLEASPELTKVVC